MTGPREQFRPADHDNDHFILTTVVGSYPKPKWLHRARDLHEDDDANFENRHFEEAKDDASRLITREHEQAGLDVVVDGQNTLVEAPGTIRDRVEWFTEQSGEDFETAYATINTPTFYLPSGKFEEKLTALADAADLEEVQA